MAKKMMIKNYRGYIGSNLAFGRSVPQHIQQLVIRDYCRCHGLKFLLSATEYVINDSILILDHVINDINIEGIVFYSIGLLPKDKTARKRIYSCGKDIRFAAESIHKVDEELFETAFTVSNYHAGSEFPSIATYLNKA